MPTSLLDPRYGESDLNPFGGGIGPGGGMIIDPEQAMRGMIDPLGRVPGRGGGFGGMVPPGARFDPIGPPMMPQRGRGPRGSRFNNPDPDGLNPPGWEDMYM